MSSSSRDAAVAVSAPSLATPPGAGCRALSSHMIASAAQAPGSRPVSRERHRRLELVHDPHASASSGSFSPRCQPAACPATSAANLGSLVTIDILYVTYSNIEK